MNIDQIIGILIFIGIMIIVFGGLYWLQRDVGNVHGELREFKRLAIEASTEAQLLNLRHQFIQFAQKECCIRPYGAHAMEVLSYINGKLAGIKRD
jgi:hypothetical protein